MLPALLLTVLMPHMVLVRGADLLSAAPTTRLDALPNLPNHWELYDYGQQARTLHGWLISEPDSSVATFNHTVASPWYSGRIMSLPAYLGDDEARRGPGQALGVVGFVYGSALLGLDTRRAGVPPESIAAYADGSGVVWNNIPGKTAVLPTFWYGLMPQFMLYGALELLDVPQRHDMLSRAVTAWAAAADVMADDFNHTGFDFATMTAVDNGRWTEGDAAGGIALLAVWAAHDASAQTRGGAAVAAADALAMRGLAFLDRQTVSPLYECIMPQAVLAAARMNAARNTSFNVTKMLSFALSNGHNQHRQGWGMMAGGTRWGGRDVGGLMGSRTDGGGYAFAGNLLWTLAALMPVPRYSPDLGRTIAKWAYNALNAGKYFVGDRSCSSSHSKDASPGLGGGSGPGGCRESNPRDPWDVHDVVMYEGLRRCDYDRTVRRCRSGDAFGPFKTGDWCERVNCTNITSECPDFGKNHPNKAPCLTKSDRALYGGGAIGIAAAVASPTNASTVLQLDVVATDAYSDAGIEFLYFNPSTTRPVWVQVTSKKCLADRTYDVVAKSSGQVLATGIDCSIAGGGEGIARGTIEIPPDTAVLVDVRL